MAPTNVDLRRASSTGTVAVVGSPRRARGHACFTASMDSVAAVAVGQGHRPRTSAITIRSPVHRRSSGASSTVRSPSPTRVASRPADPRPRRSGSRLPSLVAGIASPEMIQLRNLLADELRRIPEPGQARQERGPHRFHPVIADALAPVEEAAPTTATSPAVRSTCAAPRRRSLAPTSSRSRNHRQRRASCAPSQEAIIRRTAAASARPRSRAAHSAGPASRGSSASALLASTSSRTGGSKKAWTPSAVSAVVDSGMNG